MPRPILTKSQADRHAIASKGRESPIEQAQEALSPSAFASSSATSLPDVSMLPPSLAPSKAPPMSLIEGEKPAVRGESPKILPPASRERVRSLTSHSIDSDFSSQSRSSSVSSLPFVCDAKAPPQVDVNPVSASPHTSSMEAPMESATERLRKLSSSWKDGGPAHEEDGIEMRRMQQRDVFEGRHGNQDDVDSGEEDCSTRTIDGADIQNLWCVTKTFRPSLKIWKQGYTIDIENLYYTDTSVSANDSNDVYIIEYDCNNGIYLVHVAWQFLCREVLWTCPWFNLKIILQFSLHMPIPFFYLQIFILCFFLCNT